MTIILILVQYTSSSVPTIVYSIVLCINRKKKKAKATLCPKYTAARRTWYTERGPANKRRVDHLLVGCVLLIALHTVRLRLTDLTTKLVSVKIGGRVINSTSKHSRALPGTINTIYLFIEKY